MHSRFDGHNLYHPDPSAPRQFRIDNQYVKRGVNKLVKAQESGADTFDRIPVYGQLIATSLKGGPFGQGHQYASRHGGGPLRETRPSKPLGSVTDIHRRAFDHWAAGPDDGYVCRG
jgi:hypothetical protein